MTHRRRMARVALAAAWTALFLVGGAVRGAAQERACALEPGRSSHDLEVVLGDARRYHARVGAKAVAPAPLLIVWHGWGGRPTTLEERFAPDLYWPEAVLIAPEGLPRALPEAGPRRRPGWQFVAGEYGDRDLAFFDALLEDATQRFCIDPERVTLAGYSNGGAFVNLLGCLRGGRLAGIAPVSSGGPPDGLACTGPLPVLIQHGRDDDVIPLRTGLESFAHWAGANACDAPPADLPRGCSEARGCAVPTRFCLTLSGHDWPIGTSQRIVDFLRAQRRGEPAATAPTPGAP